MEIKICFEEKSIIKIVPFKVKFDDGSILEGNIVKTLTSIGGFPVEDISLEIVGENRDLLTPEIEEQILDAYSKEGL